MIGRLILYAQEKGGRSQLGGLSDRNLRVFRELTRTLFDAGEGVNETRLDWVTGELREITSRMGALTRLAVRFSLVFLQLSPLFFIGKLRRFTSLSLPARRHYLEKIERGSLAALTTALRIYPCAVYLEHPDAFAEMRYDGRPLLMPFHREMPEAKP
jgi:hypothetical protein